MHEKKRQGSDRQEDWEFKLEGAARVQVLRLSVEELSCKEN